MFGIPALMIGVPVATLLAVFVFKWCLGYLERRGAFPEISDNPMSRSMGNALLQVQAIVEPQKRHVIEMKERDAIRKDEAESGEGR